MFEKSLALRKLEKEKQIKSKVSRRIRIRIEIDQQENNGEINETKSCLFEKKVSKPLMRLTKKKRGHKSLISEMKVGTS